MTAAHSTLFLIHSSLYQTTGFILWAEWQRSPWLGHVPESESHNQQGQSQHTQAWRLTDQIRPEDLKQVGKFYRMASDQYIALHHTHCIVAYY